MDDLEELMVSVETVTVGVVEVAGELKLEVELEGVTDLLQSHWSNLNSMELLLMDEQWKSFLKMEEKTFLKMQ